MRRWRASCWPPAAAPSASDALYPGRLIIGRTAANDLQIESRFVSRHHCQIVTTAHSCVIEDLNSTNGIFLHSKRVRYHNLNDGDVVTIGQHELLYIDERVAAPRAGRRPRRVGRRRMTQADAGSLNAPLRAPPGGLKASAARQRLIVALGGSGHDAHQYSACVALKSRRRSQIAAPPTITPSSAGNQQQYRQRSGMQPIAAAEQQRAGQHVQPPAGSHRAGWIIASRPP